MGEEALGVSLGTVEPLNDEAVKLTQFQPPPLQLETALPLQVFQLWGGGIFWIACREEGRNGVKTIKSN